MPLMVGQLKIWQEREGKTCTKGPQGGVKPTAAAEDSQTQYMEWTLHQLSHQAIEEKLFNHCIITCVTDNTVKDVTVMFCRHFKLSV